MRSVQPHWTLCVQWPQHLAACSAVTVLKFLRVFNKGVCIFISCRATQIVYLVLLYLTVMTDNISFSKTQISQNRVPGLALDSRRNQEQREVLPYTIFLGSYNLSMCNCYLCIHTVFSITLGISEV